MTLNDKVRMEIRGKMIAEKCISRVLGEPGSVHCGEETKEGPYCGITSIPSDVNFCGFRTSEGYCSVYRMEHKIKEMYAQGKTPGEINEFYLEKLVPR